MKSKFILYLWLVLIKIVISTCQIKTSLTLEQQINVKEFISAKQISYQNQKSLIEAYSSLSNVGQYKVQIQSSYSIDVSNIQDCTQFSKYITFSGYNDIWICLQNKILILNCSQQWELSIQCGTFLELHRPFTTQIFNSRKIFDSDTSNPINLDIIGTCAGTHHIWLVYSTRVGKIIKSVKPIFISYPGCKCQA